MNSPCRESPHADSAGLESHPLDICRCGDYRRSHEGPDGLGACGLNGLGHGGPGPCFRFEISQRWTDDRVWTGAPR